MVPPEPEIWHLLVIPKPDLGAGVCPPLLRALMPWLRPLWNSGKKWILGHMFLLLGQGAFEGTRLRVLWELVFFGSPVPFWALDNTPVYNQIDVARGGINSIFFRKLKIFYSWGTS